MNIAVTDTTKAEILVVDDHPENLHFLYALLTKRGYQVRTAVNGSLAVAECRSVPPDVVLLDILIPGISGYEVCSSLKADAQTCDIPIIFLSALNEVSSKLKAFDVGGNDYITKPCYVQEVLAKIENQLKWRSLSRQLREQNTRLQQEISKRIALENSLRLEEAKLRAAFQANPNPIAIASRTNGAIQDVNHSFLEVTGYTRAEIIGSPASQFNCWVNAEPGYTLQELLAQAKNLRNLEVNFLTQSNTIKTGLLTLELITLHHEKNLFLITLTETTQQKHLETQLRQTQQILKTITDNLPLAISIKDVTNNFRFTQWNKNCEAMFGIPREQAIGHAVHDLYPPDQAEGFHAQDLAVITKGKRLEIAEERIENQAQKTVWARTIKQPIYDSNGCITHLLCISENITPRKQAEAWLLSLESVMTASDNGITISDATQSNYPIIYVNPAFEALSGYSTSEIIGKNFCFLQGTDTNQPELQLLQEAMQAGKQCSVTLRNYRKDGSLFWNSLSVSPLRDASGNLTHLIGVQVDITEKKRVEEELRLAKERFELALFASRDGFWDWNLVTGELYLSPRWKEMIGYEDSELTNELASWEKVIFAEDKVAALKLVEDYNSGRVPQFLTTQRFYHKNGSIVYILSQAIHLKDENGQVVRMVGTHTEITELVETQKALQQSQSLLEGLLNSSLDGVNAFAAVRDKTQAIVDFKWLLVNRAAEKMAGRNAGELVGQSLLQEMPETRTNGLFDMYVQVVETGIPQEQEFYYENEGIKSWFQAVVVKLGDGLAVTFRDTTERRLAENALLDSEAELRALFAAMTDLVMVRDVQGRCLKIAPTNTTSWVKPSAEQLGTTLQEELPPDVANYLLDSIQQALRTQQTVNVEYSVMAGGREVWLDAKISPLSAESVIIVGRDISDRKRVEAALKESEERFRVLVNSAPVGIFQTDPAGDCVFVNPRWLEITGLPLAAAIGPGWAETLHPDERQSVFGDWYEAALSGREFARECRLLTPEGELVWVFARAVAMRGATGTITGYFGTLTDISDRKQAESALRESEARFQQLAANVPGLIYTAVQRPDGSNRFEYVSSACREIQELEPEQILGNATLVYNQIHPEDRGRLEAAETASAQTLEPCTCEWRIVTPSGKLKWLQGNSRPEYRSNGDLLWHGVVTEISDRKRVEEALQQQIQRALLLGHITQEIRSSLDAQQIFQTAVTQIGRTFGVSRCIIQTYIKVPAPSIPVVAEYLEPNYRSVLNAKVSAVGNPHLDRILAQDAAIASDNVYVEPLLQFAHSICRLFQIQSMLAVRTSYQGEANGAIGLHQCDRFRQWTAEEIELLESVAAQVGIAIAQARLLEQEKQRRKELDSHNVQLQEALRERQRMDALLDGQNRILEMIARGVPETEVLRDLARFIEQQSDEALCCFALCDASQGWLHSGIAPSLPDSYTQGLEGLPIAPSIGSCGTAAYYKATVIVSDIATDPLWENSRDLALAYGLRACWSTPIISAEGEVLATFSMYYREPRSPSQKDRDLIAKAVYLAKVVIERHRSEQNYRTIFEASYDGIVVYQIDTGAILDANQKFCDIFGLNRSEITQIDVNQLSLGEAPYSQVELKQWLKKAKSGEVLKFEWRSKHRSGRLFWTEVILKPTVLGGKERLLGVVRDISDRKQAEEALQQAAYAAEAANRTKSQFLANMSHELRTPLNAILGFTQVLARDSRLNQDQQEQLAIINRSGEHLLGLINDVLSMSKIESGRVTLKENSFDLFNLLNTIEEMLQNKAASKGLQLFFERGLEVPQYVKADESKLRQVLINLLGNAIKFTETGYVVLRVSTKLNQETLTDSCEKLTLYFEIEDTGSGIAPEEIDTLFEAFVQTETGRNSQEGTGLGLPISRQFVQLMGGEIAVSSTIGQGTIFRFDIQMSLADSIEVEAPSLTRRVIGLVPNQPVYRLLVVEDKLENRKLLIKLLEPVGFEIREAENGLEGIAVWESWQPHLIWMDMRMPVMNGYQATQHIKSTPQGQNTIVIALTASALEEDRSKILAAGCDDFIGKPFRENVLFEKMAHYLGVRYLYEGETLKQESEPVAPEEVTPEDMSVYLALLPPDWVVQLHQAALCGDDEVILQLLEQIPDVAAPLAECLTKFVNDYLFDKITSLTARFTHD
ncbi:MAG: PAS domain S-box protein [Actinomycetota bacterium]